VTRRPRLTIRARLTLLNTGLFALCGAIVVVVSYTLMAQLGTPGQSPQSSPPRGVPAGIAARCRSESLLANPDKSVLAKCNAAFQRQGAQNERDLTLSHLLAYSLITVAVVIALAAILGWIAAGRALRPVHRITEAARAASEHNLSARVAPRGPRDELASSRRRSTRCSAGSRPPSRVSSDSSPTPPMNCAPRSRSCARRST
jgi:HAMP domain-containing protein